MTRDIAAHVRLLEHGLPNQPERAPYDAWQEGVTAADYVNRIRARRRNR